MGSRALETPRARPRASGTAAIDRAYLARFTHGNDTLAREVLELFAAQAPFYLEALRRAATDRDWQRAAHTIKGAAAAVGAQQLKRLAELAEHLGRGAPGAARAAERELAVGVIAEATAAACREINEMFAP